LTAPATTHLYPLSLHDALPILSIQCLAALGAGAAWRGDQGDRRRLALAALIALAGRSRAGPGMGPCPRCAGNGSFACEDEHRSRSEEHTSELQSLTNLVCRLLL